MKNWGETEPTHTIRGICNTIRFDDFYPLYPTYIECHSEAALLGWRGNNAEFCVRVRPDADGVDFPSRFRKDMKVQLRVGNFIFWILPLLTIFVRTITAATGR